LEVKGADKALGHVAADVVVGQAAHPPVVEARAAVGMGGDRPR
jgi:hypothetical protein